MSEEKLESLNNLAKEFLEQGSLVSLDKIASELYGTTYRSLSPWGQEKIANMIGVTTTSEDETDLITKLAEKTALVDEMGAALREAQDQIEYLEIDNFDLEMENLRLKNSKRRRE